MAVCLAFRASVGLVLPVEPIGRNDRVELRVIDASNRAAVRFARQRDKLVVAAAYLLNHSDQTVRLRCSAFPGDLLQAVLNFPINPLALFEVR